MRTILKSLIAVSVLATVIGRTSNGALLVDAGSLALSADTSANEHSPGTGYGLVLDAQGREFEGRTVRIDRINQEHGFVVSVPPFPPGALPLGDGIEHHTDQDRAEQRSDEHREDGAAVAEGVTELLARNDDRPRDRTHAAPPVCGPASATNASSRSSWPVCWRRASAVPAATTRPLASTTIVSQSADTSCMT